MARTNDDAQVQAALAAAPAHLSPEAVAHLRGWLTDSTYAEFRDEILDRAQGGDWVGLEDAFYTVIPFGTGGRRGPRGAGPNRINGRTIAESAKGLVDWVLAGGAANAGAGIVIAHDTRHGSVEFSRVCAEVIAAAGVHVYLFDGFRSTPELSFAVRHLRAAAGIVVSASHNPPGDNGFKAYDRDGGQLVPPDDAAVMDRVEELGSGPIPMADFAEASAAGHITLIGDNIDQAYFAALDQVLLAQARDVRVVYTPLHGVGSTAVLPSFARAGFRDVHVVEEQNIPDGDFPNVADHIPNPEVPAALAQATALAQRLDADLALGTDPDADRLGCVARRVRHGATEWRPLNGNQIGALLCHYVLHELQSQQRLPSDPLVVRTAVTTSLIDRIAHAYGAGVISDLLVGFKYVACVLKHLDDPRRFVFGTEESHGYLSRDHAHDKDGMNAALLMAEAAARLKEDGHDLWWQLDQIYRTFGYFREGLENYVRPGKAGQQEIVAMLDRLRARPPATIGGMVVKTMVDRLHNRALDVRTGAALPYEHVKDPKTGVIIEQLTLARDNLLIFDLEGGAGLDGATVAIRPSGTEPKCKFYVSVHRDGLLDTSDDDLDGVKAEVDALADALKRAVVQSAVGSDT